MRFGRRHLAQRSTPHDCAAPHKGRLVDGVARLPRPHRAAEVRGDNEQLLRPHLEGHTRVPRRREQLGQDVAVFDSLAVT